MIALSILTALLLGTLALIGYYAHKAPGRWSWEPPPLFSDEALRGVSEALAAVRADTEALALVVRRNMAELNKAFRGGQ